MFASPFYMESITFGIPASLAEWIKGADSNGALLGRPPLYENRVIEARISVQPQATMTLALAQIASIEDKLLECAQNANGLALVWTPTDTATSITFRCLLGEIVDLPISWESRYFAKAPEFGIRMTCLPFGEGAEYLAGTVTSSDPMQVLTLTDVKGDVPGLGRLIVTDAASQSRRWICWGLESRWLPTASAPSLIIDSASMVSSGFAGTTATRSGAYSGASNNVISATLRTQIQAICGLGNLTHIGSFRPQLRFYASSTSIALRLTYQTLDGPYRSLSYKVPTVVGWNHVDLGLVSIPQAPLGTQKWTGRIEAYSTGSGGETLDIDVACIVPAGLFGRGRATYAHTPGVVVGYDDFTGITTGTPLDTRVAPAGGTWATDGATGDFLAALAPGTGTDTEAMARTSTAVGSRYAILEAATFTDTEVSFNFATSGAELANNVGVQMAALVRYVDPSNNCDAALKFITGGLQLVLRTIVGGVITVLASTPVSAPTTEDENASAGSSVEGTLRLLAFSSGTVIAQVLTRSGGVLNTIRGTSTALATGGALASGKVGMRDNGDVTGGTFTRYYDTFAHAVPTAEPIVCYAGQSIEFRHDNVLREDSTGTYAGPPPEYVGGRFTVPPAGGPDRQARIAVMAKRYDVETAADDYIADSTTAEVYVTPRYLAVPRA